MPSPVTTPTELVNSISWFARRMVRLKRFNSARIVAPHHEAEDGHVQAFSALSRQTFDRAGVVFQCPMKRFTSRKGRLKEIRCEAIQVDLVQLRPRHAELDASLGETICGDSSHIDQERSGC